MANDRLLLRCRVCLDTTLLAKWWGNGFSAAQREDTLLAFVKKHWLCEGNSTKAGVADMFELLDERALAAPYPTSVPAGPS